MNRGGSGIGNGRVRSRYGPDARCIKALEKAERDAREEAKLRQARLLTSVYAIRQRRAERPPQFANARKPNSRRVSDESTRLTRTLE